MASHPQPAVAVIDAAIIEASFLYIVVAAGPILLVATKTKGEKQALSTSQICSSCARHFSCSWT